MTILSEVWTLPLPEKYPPLEYYIKRVKALEQQLAETRQAWKDCREEFTELRRELAEARAALAEVERRFTMTYRVPRYAKQWQERHAAALKAASEAK